MSAIIDAMSFAEFLERGPLRAQCAEYLKDKRRRKASCFTPQTVIYFAIELNYDYQYALRVNCPLEGRRHSCIRGNTLILFLEFESDAIQIRLTHSG